MARITKIRHALGMGIHLAKAWWLGSLLERPAATYSREGSPKFFLVEDDGAEFSLGTKSCLQKVAR